MTIHGIYLSSLAQSTPFTLNLKSDTFISACSHQAMQYPTLKDIKLNFSCTYLFILIYLLNLFYILVIFKLLVISHVINAVILIAIFIFTYIWHFRSIWHSSNFPMWFDYWLERFIFVLKVICDASLNRLRYIYGICKKCLLCFFCLKSFSENEILYCTVLPVCSFFQKELL